MPIRGKIPGSGVSKQQEGGFTLIEIAVVLVVIGLIVGGVLVGQSLISAAAVRAQISQIEKYNTAANTFYGKYGYLPGDIRDPDASSFGFVARGQYAGEGDGNGIIEGNSGNCSGCNNGDIENAGETVLFWSDLSTAHLIEGNFTGNNTPNAVNFTTAAQFDTLWPRASIGNGNYSLPSGYGQSYYGNYFGLIGVSKLTSQGIATTTVGITVSQAYAIDAKVDDGLPITGRVTATFLRAGTMASYAEGGPPYRLLGTLLYNIPITGYSTTCFDNAGSATNLYVYSVKQNNGNGVNCALSFKLQAGD
jgi:prepilin-type N-terminal cleavage/methylation domain-containing protein